MIDVCASEYGFPVAPVKSMLQQRLGRNAERCRVPPQGTSPPPALSEISVGFSQPNLHVLIIRQLINNSKVTRVLLKISAQLNNGVFWPISSLSFSLNVSLYPFKILNMFTSCPFLQMQKTLNMKIFLIFYKRKGFRHRNKLLTWMDAKKKSIKLVFF